MSENKVEAPIVMSEKESNTELQKFYPRQQVDVKDVHSIVWSGRHGGYLLTSDGKLIGNFIATTNEYLKITNNNYSPVEELGFNNPFKYDIDGYVEQNMTGMSTVRMNITERIDDNQLPFGVFRLTMTNEGVMFIPYKTTVEAQNIVDNKNLKELVKDFLVNGVQGRKNKKGFLLYGPPGNGKTTEVMSLFSICEEFKVRIYLVDSRFSMGYLHGAQKLLERDKNIFIMEEITERVNGHEIEHLLTFLDGETSWNNTVVIATTNYPEDLPANLVDRPGRFDTFIEYNNPSKEEVTKLGEKFGFKEEDLTSLQGRGFSFDYCSFIMAKAVKNKETIKETILKEDEKRKKISSTFKGKMGI